MRPHSFRLLWEWASTHFFEIWIVQAWQTKILKISGFGFCEDCCVLNARASCSSICLLTSFGAGYVGHKIPQISWSKHACIAFLYALLQFWRSSILIQIHETRKGTGEARLSITTVRLELRPRELFRPLNATMNESWSIDNLADRPRRWRLDKAHCWKETDPWKYRGVFVEW